MCVGGGGGDVVAVGEAVRAFAGFATVGHAHIRGLAQDLDFPRFRRHAGLVVVVVVLLFEGVSLFISDRREHS